MVSRNSIDDNNEQLSGWVEKCKKALIETMPLNSLFENSSTSKLNQGEKITLSALYTACYRTSTSVLVLIDNRRIWDSEILMRTVAEGSMKVMFLLSKNEEFKNRYNEYANVLFDIEGINQHKKSKILLDTVENPDAEKWKPIRDVLFSADDYKRLVEKYPRALRSSVERRWGFAGLIQQLNKENIVPKDLFLILLHGYSVASHHIHADYSGVASAMERDTRDTKRRDLICMAHASRFISDVFWFAFLRLFAAHKFLDNDTKSAKKFVEKYKEMQEELSEATKNWSAIEYG